MQQRLSVPESNRKGELARQKLEQLEAKLWLESSLNQLTERLHDCLHSTEFPTNVVEPVAVYQTLVTHLNTALENNDVALALPHRINAGKLATQEPAFKICYMSPGRIGHRELPFQIKLSAGILPLKQQDVLSKTDLQYLQSQQPRSAWPLIEAQDNILGWLIVSIAKKPFVDHALVADTQLKLELIERALAMTAKILAYHRRVVSLISQAQQLEIHNRELIRTNQLKSEFLANTSHEIRTPLSSILGFTHLLLAQGYNPDNLRHQEYLNIILNSGQHLLAVINDILDLSKIAANQLEICWEQVNVPELCQSVLTLVKEKANDKGLELRLELDSAVSSVVADALRLKQMLFNLLSNALKFTNQGTIGLQVKKQGLFLHFTVWDTGTGIPQEEQHKLFQPYSQIANIIASRQEGTGLGLALTQKLAELHGGWVEVQSELNHGSRFTVALPLTIEVKVIEPNLDIGPSPANATRQESPPVNGTEVDIKPGIMLVEDDLHNAKLMKTYLSKIGYQVTWVKNSTQMWEALHNSLPALILMDVHLPEVDGLTLLQSIQAQQQFQNIPIIVQTAMAMKGDRENCLAAGATDYISKPIDLKALAALIAKYSHQSG